VSLTGPFFATVVVLLTLAGFVALILIWPRLAGTGVRRILVRSGALLGVNALVLLTAAILLNGQFLFFADWGDLRGALNGSAATTNVVRGASAAQAASAVVPGSHATAPGTLPPLPSGPIGPNGVLTRTVTGPLSGITASVVVELPPGYTDPAQATVRYPVLETFQGYPAAPTQWIHSMNLSGVMDSAVRAHRMHPALIVSPQIEVPAGVDTECVNGTPGNAQLDTWLTRDVPDWVQRTFRVRPDRTAWAAIGLSAGGWCAAMSAMLHPAQYSAAIVMGGYFRPTFGPAYDPYPARSSLETHYDLVRLAAHQPPPVALWLETSHADPLSYSSSAALLHAAKPPTAVNATVLQHAGHRLSVWEGLLPTALTWLGANIPGFAAT